ncbi:MAG: 1-acyl-sn-glycerol-3-phosphate acyltransferase [Elusimicrobia bacterium CG08_land_8_20_14_0_20_59_10]|nr:MAG: 1-acyl-sn-glycerol-3-phosphate acyltransferase [Elusimicrobia bacterium CG08_land_8_20_14_0_20_59_10]
MIKLSLDLVLFIFRTWLRIFNSIEVKGLEKIPRTGPLIIACNHLSISDPPALLSFTALTRRVNVMAKKELFSIPVLGWFILRWGAIPVDRKKEGGDLGALRGCLAALKRNGCLTIFPEGTRAKGRKLPAKSGVAFLAHKSGAPVLTARIFNSDNFAKLGKITVKYGNIRHFEPQADLKAAYAQFSESLLSDIFSITKE